MIHDFTLERIYPVNGKNLLNEEVSCWKALYLDQHKHEDAKFTYSIGVVPVTEYTWLEGDEAS